MAWRLISSLPQPGTISSHEQTGLDRRAVQLAEDTAPVPPYEAVAEAIRSARAEHDP